MASPLCPKHLFEEYYAKHLSCLKEFLMRLAEKVWEGRMLTDDEEAFLREVERVFPKLRDEFPILFSEERTT